MTNTAYQVAGVPAILIPRMWLFAEPYIKRALDHTAGEITPDDLRQSCIDRDVQLWLVNYGSRVVGAATTEILNYPRKKHCRVITLSGSKVDEWADKMDVALTEWAASIGCDAMEAHVRRGMVPRLAPLGYKHFHSVVIKKIAIIGKVQAGE